MKSSRFLLVTLCCTAALLAAVAAFNAWHDPFQQYRLAAPGKAAFPRQLQRYINPGLAKNADYAFVITGSSLMENYSLGDVEQRCGLRAINLATSAISAFEQRKLLETALSHRKVQRVLMTLDFNSFAVAPDKSLPEITDPLPLYLYDRNPFNDVRYLLNADVSRRILTQSRTPVRSDADSAWRWDQDTSFGRKKALAGIDPSHINKNFKQGARTLPAMLASFEANIAALVAAHPDTEFNLVFPPYSVVVWADFAQRNQVEVSLEFKREVFARLAKYPHVRVHDTQWDARITHDLDLYTDIYHFHPSVNQRLLSLVCGGDNQYVMTATTTPLFLTRLREQVRTLDIRSIFSAQ